MPVDPSLAGLLEAIEAGTPLSALSPTDARAVFRALTVDGRALVHSSVRLVDAEGRALAAYAGGIVPPGHLYLHSDYAGSYDSRYFGPLPDAGLLGLARPVATIDP